MPPRVAFADVVVAAVRGGSWVGVGDDTAMQAL